MWDDSSGRHAHGDIDNQRMLVRTPPPNLPNNKESARPAAADQSEGIAVNTPDAVGKVSSKITQPTLPAPEALKMVRSAESSIRVRNQHIHPLIAQHRFPGTPLAGSPLVDLKAECLPRQQGVYEVIHSEKHGMISLKSNDDGTYCITLSSGDETTTVQLKQINAAYTTMVLSPGEDMLLLGAADTDAPATLVNLNTLDSRQLVIPPRSGWVNASAGQHVADGFSLDGKLALTTTNHKTYRWDTTTGEFLLVESVVAPNVAAHGNRMMELVLRVRAEITVREVGVATELAKFTAPEGTIDARISADGTLIATEDGTTHALTIFDIHGRRLAEIPRSTAHQSAWNESIDFFGHHLVTRSRHALVCQDIYGHEQVLMPLNGEYGKVHCSDNCIVFTSGTVSTFRPHHPLSSTTATTLSQ